MAAAENNVDLKRKAEDNQAEDGEGEEEEWAGPMPSEATKVKKRKGVFLALWTPHLLVNLWLLLNDANHANQTPANCCWLCFSSVLEYERVYLDNLPSAAMYERSYMHRDVITQIVCYMN